MKRKIGGVFPRPALILREIVPRNAGFDDSVDRFRRETGKGNQLCRGDIAAGNLLFKPCRVMPFLIFESRIAENAERAESQALMEAAAQTVTMLVIDKKKLKLKEAGFPKMVYDQTPKYLRRSKVPVVKAKIGPKVMTLMADPKVFEALPVKAEVKVVMSGIYITEIKSVRGGSVVTPPKKKGFFSRFRRDKSGKTKEKK